MKLLKRLLVSIDFGPYADQVVDQAIFLGKTFNSDIALLHVIPTNISRECDLEGLVQPSKEMLKTYAAKFEKAGLKVTSNQVACAEPFEELIAQAEKLQSNMIIVGEKDYEPETDPDIGVTAWRVIRKSQKPVWVVKRSSAKSIKTILCPVDFSDASHRALKSAVTLARQAKIKLDILHIQEQAHQLPGHYEPLFKKEKNKGSNENKIAEELDRFLKKNDFHQIEWQKHLITGEPRQAILHAVELFKADVLMMGSIGRDNPNKILIGAVAEKVIKQAKQHVVCFKNEHAIKLEVADALRDIDENFQHGKQLLEHGMAEDALDFFEHCLKEDIMFIPAWEGLAESYHRLGQEEEAKHALDNIDKINKIKWEKKVEFELKNRFWK